MNQAIHRPDLRAVGDESDVDVAPVERREVAVFVELEDLSATSSKRGCMRTNKLHARTNLTARGRPPRRVHTYSCAIAPQTTFYNTQRSKYIRAFI